MEVEKRRVRKWASDGGRRGKGEERKTEPRMRCVIQPLRGGPGQRGGPGRGCPLVPDSDTHTDTQRHIHIHTHTNTHTHTHTNKDTYISTHTHTHIDTYMYTHTHTHIRRSRYATSVPRHPHLRVEAR